MQLKVNINKNLMTDLPAGQQQLPKKLCIFFADEKTIYSVSFGDIAIPEL